MRNATMVEDRQDGTALAMANTRIAALEKAVELAFGCLWMIDPERNQRAYVARCALAGVMDQPAKKRGIQAAMNAGFEADHPPGCHYWAGKKTGEKTEAEIEEAEFAEAERQIQTGGF